MLSVFCLIVCYALWFKLYNYCKKTHDYIAGDEYQYAPSLYSYEWCWQGDINLNRDGSYLKCTQDSDCHWKTPCHPSGCGLIG